MEDTEDVLEDVHTLLYGEATMDADEQYHLAYAAPDTSKVEFLD